MSREDQRNDSWRVAIHFSGDFSESPRGGGAGSVGFKGMYLGSYAQGSSYLEGPREYSRRLTVTGNVGPGKSKGRKVRMTGQEPLFLRRVYVTKVACLDRIKVYRYRE